MKTRTSNLIVALALLALATLNSAKRRAVAWRRRINPSQFDALKTFMVILAFFCLAFTVFAQGTAFTYQGQLQSNGGLASGTYNLTFSLFNTNTSGVAIAGPVTNSAVIISNGLFTVTIDFGSSVWNGETNWLQIGVESNNAASFTTLMPRQELTPTPYAVTAESVDGTILTSQLTSIGNTNGGSGNFFVGSSGNATTGGSDNTGLGNGALQADTSGSGNTAVGVSALTTSTNSSYNTAVGYAALTFFMSGSDNTAVGYSAEGNTIGGGNTAVGYKAFNSPNDVGNAMNNNTAIGENSLYALWKGDNNTAVGFEALQNSTNDSELVAIGCQALQNDDAAGQGSPSGYGENTAIGYQALQLDTSGYDNTAEGYQALYSNTNGNSNTANGYHALFLNTSGSGNTANGVEALNASTSGTDNTANGCRALYSSTNGTYNTANGYEALYFLTTGDRNTADGTGALDYLTNGTDNIALGYLAGGSVNNGTNNIEIGNPGQAADDDVIRIGVQGTQTDTVIAGIYGATLPGGEGATTVYVDDNGHLGTMTSSAKYKRDIQPMGDASDALLKLQPVTFKYKPDIDPKGARQFGLVAEAVDKVDPELVVRDHKNQIYSVRYEAVNAMLLNEFLKQHQTVQDQHTAIQGLNQKLTEDLDRQDAKNAELQKEFAAKDAEIADLKARLERLEQTILKQKPN